GVGGALGVADRTVAVGVDRGPVLKGRDLGGVHDGHRRHLVRRHGQPDVLVDREVAHRMGQRQQQRDGLHHDVPRAARARRATGASTGEKYGLSESASARSVRAAEREPRASSIMPWWYAYEAEWAPDDRASPL